MIFKEFWYIPENFLFTILMMILKLQSDVKTPRPRIRNTHAYHNICHKFFINHNIFCIIVGVCQAFIVLHIRLYSECIFVFLYTVNVFSIMNVTNSSM